MSADGKGCEGRRPSSTHAMLSPSDSVDSSNTAATSPTAALSSIMNLGVGFPAFSNDDQHDSAGTPKSLAGLGLVAVRRLAACRLPHRRRPPGEQLQPSVQ